MKKLHFLRERLNSLKWFVRFQAYQEVRARLYWAYLWSSIRLRIHHVLQRRDGFREIQLKKSNLLRLISNKECHLGLWDFFVGLQIDLLLHSVHPLPLKRKWELALFLLKFHLLDFSRIMILSHAYVRDLFYLTLTWPESIILLARILLLLRQLTSAKIGLLK